MMAGFRQNMFGNKMFYLNEHFHKNHLERINIQDRGLLLGDGLFETLRADQHNIAFFKEHYNRLKNSADFLEIPLNKSQFELQTICEILLQKNQLRQTAAIRITLTRGASDRGIGLPEKTTPTLLITANAYSAPTKSITAYLTNNCVNEHSLLAQHKTLEYSENILARKLAKAQGADEAILVNTKGNLVETSVGNLFIEIDGTLITPPLSEGALPGIMREHIIKDSQLKGKPCVEETITPNDLLLMTACFHCNSLIGKQMITTVESPEKGC